MKHPYSYYAAALLVVLSASTAMFFLYSDSDSDGDGDNSSTVEPTPKQKEAYERLQKKLHPEGLDVPRKTRAEKAYENLQAKRAEKVAKKQPTRSPQEQRDALKPDIQTKFEEHVFPFIKSYDYQVDQKGNESGVFTSEGLEVHVPDAGITLENQKEIRAMLGKIDAFLSKMEEKLTFNFSRKEEKDYLKSEDAKLIFISIIRRLQAIDVHTQELLVSYNQELAKASDKSEKNSIKKMLERIQTTQTNLARFARDYFGIEPEKLPTASYLRAQPQKTREKA